MIQLSKMNNEGRRRFTEWLLKYFKHNVHGGQIMVEELFEACNQFNKLQDFFMIDVIEILCAIGWDTGDQMTTVNPDVNNILELPKEFQKVMVKLFEGQKTQVLLRQLTAEETRRVTILKGLPIMCENLIYDSLELFYQLWCLDTRLPYVREHIEITPQASHFNSPFTDVKKCYEHFCTYFDTKQTTFTALKKFLLDKGHYAGKGYVKGVAGVNYFKDILVPVVDNTTMGLTRKAGYGVFYCPLNDTIVDNTLFELDGFSDKALAARLPARLERFRKIHPDSWSEESTRKLPKEALEEAEESQHADINQPTGAQEHGEQPLYDDVKSERIKISQEKNKKAQKAREKVRVDIGNEVPSSPDTNVNSAIRNTPHTAIDSINLSGDIQRKLPPGNYIWNCADLCIGGLFFHEGISQTDPALNTYEHVWWEDVTSSVAWDSLCVKMSNGCLNLFESIPVALRTMVVEARAIQTLLTAELSDTFRETYEPIYGRVEIDRLLDSHTPQQIIVASDSTLSKILARVRAMLSGWISGQSVSK